ncbi:MAG TPA: potassium transporter [Acholeplasmatales bacterium]|nr:MAG: hypothetical protein A2Y16_01345 [Tenericutes bacterium GWF2_57_13]HAQ56488.1 potassium transporter [Acholeplasmatales bacterium]
MLSPADVFLSDERKEVTGWRLILGYLGVTVEVVGAFCFVPLITLFFYPDEIGYAKDFIIPGALALTAGYMLSLFIKGNPVKRLEKHQDALLIVLAWIIMIVICAMPYLMSGDYNFIQSLFEATSGFTTTGLSVVDVASAPHIILLYRSLTLFIGGVGLVLVITSVLSDRYGMRLYSAEGHSDKLLPNLVKSARLILLIYLLYIVIGVIAYVIFGMPVFDAFNHSIAAVSTGGFSTEVDSIGAYHSLAIEIVTMALMLLGATNFFVHLQLLKGRIANVLRHGEMILLLALIALGLPVFVATLIIDSGYGFGEALRIGSFQLISAITTTGFQTVASFRTLSGIFNGFVIVLMLIGAGIGSTGGGIKQQRVLISLKSIVRNIRANIANHRKLTTIFLNKAGTKSVLEEHEKNDAVSFVLLYLIIFIVGSLIFTAYGYPLGDAMFEFASSLGTVGLSVGITGFSAPNGILLTSIFGMFVGRLEIMVILYAFARCFGAMRKRAA